MQKILLAELDRTDETVSSDLQPLDEDSTGKEWTEMQEMLSVALDDIEDELFEISSVERTHEEMEKLSKLTGRLVQSFIQRIPGNGIPVECEFRANGASPKFYPVRLFPNNLTEHDDGLAHAVDNTLPCGL